VRQLNAGCGRDVREGFVNVDIHPAPGVVLADVERLPFKDGVFDEVLASKVLEHVLRFDQAWRELHRVLRVGGILEVLVPYGFNTDPYHVRFFDRRSVRMLTDKPGHCLQDLAGYQLLSMQVYNRNGFPRWHLWAWFGVDLPAFGRHRELRFVVEKVPEAYAGGRNIRFFLWGKNA